MLFDPQDPLGPMFRAAIEATLGELMAARRDDVVACESALAPIIDALTPLVTGGKHVRPALLWWSHVAVAGDPEDPAALLELAAALDVTHAGLLAHDDLMDDADTRRGQPSIHRQVALLSSTPDDGLGLAGAIVGGALLLQWAQQASDESGLLSAPARAAFNALRSHVLIGQLADAYAAAGMPLMGPDFADVLTPEATVAEIDDLKTASYTVVGPVRLGALVGGADDIQLAVLMAFATPLGRAYQTRDDVLGVFGDPAVTGKPSGDDLRSGKATSLVQNALNMTVPSASAALRAVLGRRDATEQDIAAARRTIMDCGALDVVERTIEENCQLAISALDRAELTRDGRTALASLAVACTQRVR